ncbi:MAG: hypothetical protein CR975_02325 [Gammaproteobacteria bacterium]|nr:MAG: hypothetical protein CR975_02325 [Gammaproteobacteria bacterium]
MKQQQNNRTKPAGKSRRNTSFTAVSKSAKGKHKTQNQAGVKKHFAKKKQIHRQKSDDRAVAQLHRDLEKKAKKMTTAQPQIERYGVRHLSIEAAFAGQRIDNYLRRILPNLPKSRLYQMLRKGEVRLNKKRVKAESRVSEGDILRLPPISIQTGGGTFVPEKALAEIKNNVLYQDENFMVLNKPAGIAVHSGSKNQYGIIDVVRRAFPDGGWELCHRLDKETSGCLVLANSRLALNTFQDLSIAGGIHKQYLALVKGTWAANELLINTPIEKQSVARMNAQGEFETVVEGGDKDSISVFTTREHYAKTTLMQVVIKTGKTHQIRVHAALNKHPIAMDDKYGDFKWNRAVEKLGLPRLFLHAHIIRFKAFDEIIHVSAELPDDLQRFIDLHC